MPSKRTPMIAPQVKETLVDMTVKIDRALLAKLDEHCTNIASERDYVVSQMVQVILDHDSVIPAKGAARKPSERPAPVPLKTRTA